MFRCWRREPERPNYGKIIAITVAVVVAVGAIAMVVYKLFNKYFKLIDGDCEDFLEEGCADCDVCIESEVDHAEEADADESTGD